MNSQMRIGHGYDVHRFTEGHFVTLGGVRIPHKFGLLAHSDGDVLLHALCDALLGAAALGDIGDAEIHEDASIYEASPGTLVALADANRDAERLLLVGHNPGLEQLAALMHSGQTGDYRGMPPGGIAVLGLPVGVNIEPGIATLTRFWWP